MAEDNLPAHSHTFSGNEINGSFQIRPGTGSEHVVQAGSGAFSLSRTGTPGVAINTVGQSGLDGFYSINFNATPSGTIENTGGGEDYYPPYYTVYAWERTG